MTTIAKPFGVLLLWLYELTKSYGLAVIIFALLVKVILLPFMMKSKRGTMKMARLTPQMKEIEKRHGANKQKYNEEIQKLYREEGASPFGGCIWTLIPFPILIALYYAIRLPLTTMMRVPAELIAEGGAIYEKLASRGFDFAAQKAAYLEIAETRFISSPENWSVFSGISDKLKQIDYSFLGVDLGAAPDWKFWAFDWSDSSKWLPALGLFLIPVIAALLTYLSSKISTKMNPSANADPSTAGTMNTMNLIMPIMTLWFAFIMPAALGIYWIASSFFGIIQDVWLTKHYTKVLDAEDAVRKADKMKKEAELEAKRKETERLKALNATAPNPNTSKRKQQVQQKLEQAEKMSEWERKNAPPEDKADNPSQVGTRRYARGRAYDPDRFAAAGEVSAENEAEDESVPTEDAAVENESITENTAPEPTEVSGDTQPEEDSGEE